MKFQTKLNSPYGRYTYFCLPFGIKSSNEVFQRTISQILETLMTDDILIWGQDKEVHNRRLCAVPERIRQDNMKLNRDKCKIGLSDAAYVGHTFEPNGLKQVMRK